MRSFQQAVRPFSDPTFCLCAIAIHCVNETLTQQDRPRLALVVGIDGSQPVPRSNPYIDPLFAETLVDLLTQPSLSATPADDDYAPRHLRVHSFLFATSHLVTSAQTLNDRGGQA
jgi:hypothetical protein